MIIIRKTDIEIAIKTLEPYPELSAAADQLRTLAANPKLFDNEELNISGLIALADLLITMETKSPASYHAIAALNKFSADQMRCLRKLHAAEMLTEYADNIILLGDEQPGYLHFMAEELEQLAELDEASYQRVIQRSAAAASAKKATPKVEMKVEAKIDNRTALIVDSFHQGVRACTIDFPACLSGLSEAGRFAPEHASFIASFTQFFRDIDRTTGLPDKHKNTLVLLINGVRIPADYILAIKNIETEYNKQYSELIRQQYPVEKQLPELERRLKAHIKPLPAFEWLAKHLTPVGLEQLLSTFHQNFLSTATMIIDPAAQHVIPDKFAPLQASTTINISFSGASLCVTCFASQFKAPLPEVKDAPIVPSAGTRGRGGSISFQPAFQKFKQPDVMVTATLRLHNPDVPPAEYEFIERTKTNSIELIRAALTRFCEERTQYLKKPAVFKPEEAKRRSSVSFMPPPVDLDVEQSTHFLEKVYAYNQARSDDELIALMAELTKLPNQAMAADLFLAAEYLNYLANNLANHQKQLTRDDQAFLLRLSSTLAEFSVPDAGYSSSDEYAALLKQFTAQYQRIDSINAKINAPIENPVRRKSDGKKIHVEMPEEPPAVAILSRSSG